MLSILSLKKIGGVWASGPMTGGLSLYVAIQTIFFAISELE